MKSQPVLSKAFIKSLFIVALLLPFSFSIEKEAGAESRRSAVVEAFEKVGPAVVNISTTVQERVSPFFPFSGDDFFKDFFPDRFSRKYTRTSLGSGVIIDGEKGYILTNHHVVARATEIKVITANRKEYKGRILGSSPRADLAVLQIETGGRLPEVVMGNSDDLMIGETVIAIGNPFGLSQTVTTGVVSALDRTVRLENHVYRHFIQTDASINPGNSGGPLLNIAGDLIGINTAIYQKAQGIGFAIPIGKAKRIVRELLRAGEVLLPWLGLEIQELTPKLKAYFGVPEGLTGILINDVSPGGPATGAGIKRGDVLSELGGIAVTSPTEYQEALAEFTPSDPLNITIIRKGVEKTFIVKPSTFPLDLVLDLVYRRLGLQVGEPDEAIQREYGLKGGVMIEKVVRSSEAGKIGLAKGDLILQVNNLPMKSLDDLKKAISRFRHLNALTLVVRRGSYAYTLTLPF